MNPIESLEPRTLFSTAPVIDVAVLYTPEALRRAGSVSALEARIRRSVADTNLALADSHVNAIIRLVHDEQVNYTETGSIAADLQNLQSGSAGLEGAAAVRDRWGADLVSLWVGSGDEGGRAFQPDNFNAPNPEDGFSVVQEQYADDNFVFAHEIGHNLGAGHDRSDPTPRAIPYAYGKTFPLGNYTVGDIMSDTDRVEGYSNPAVSFRGIATGNPDNAAQPADNARVMNAFASIVSSYRPTVVRDAATPLAALEQVSVDSARQTLTVKVEYADPTAILVGRLGTGDVIVTGPGSFRRAATFEGVDFNSDGPQRVATYRVGIGGLSQDPAAYAFTLAPGRLADAGGHVSPGGSLGAGGVEFADRAGPRLVTAFEVGAINATSQRFNNYVGPDSPTAFYRFTLTAPAQFTARLGGLGATVDELLVQDRNADGQIESGEVLAYPHRFGTSPETISQWLPAGTYDLWVAPPVIGTASAYELTMSASSSALPSAPPPVTPFYTAAISGYAFYDTNANGRWNSGEKPLAGAVVYLDSPGMPERKMVTTASGGWAFPKLAPGNYTVHVAPTAGWKTTTVSNYHINLTAGENFTGLLFGETKV